MIQKKKNNKTLLSLVRFHCGKIVYLLQFSFLDLKNKQSTKKKKKTKPPLGIVVEVIQCEGSRFGHLNEDSF